MLGQIAGALLGGITSLVSNDQNSQNSKEMLEMQNEFTEKMWNKNNEYNDPTNTIQRYRDAGLSDSAAVAAGIGQNTQSSQVQSSSQQAPQMNLASDAIAGYNAALQAELQQHQMDLLDSETEKNYADAGYTEAQRKTEDALRELRVKGQDIQNQLTQSEKDKIERELPKIDAEKDLIVVQKELQEKLKEQQIDLNEITNKTKSFIIALKKYEVEQLKANIQALLSQVDKNSAEASYYRYSLKVCDSVIALNYSNAYKSEQEGENLEFLNTPEQRDIRTINQKADTHSKMYGSTTSWIQTTGETIGIATTKAAEKVSGAVEDAKRNARRKRVANTIERDKKKRTISTYRLPDGGKRMIVK